MSGSIFDTLNAQNPGTNSGLMGLLGAAGGFAQGAMPTPYRGGVPFGATLGMAAQGMGNGYGTALRNQNTAAQTQGQQISNIGAASQLPLTLARPARARAAVSGAAGRSQASPIGAVS
jgi:hypothetical protein